VKIFRAKPSTILLVGCLLTLPLVWHAAPDLKTHNDRSSFYTWWIIPLVVTNWIMVDARERRHLPTYDYDTFQFWAWPFLGPIYLVQTRGWRAIFPLFFFALVLVLAALEAVLLAAVFPK
jgi:hypothetical protein